MVLLFGAAALGLVARKRFQNRKAAGTAPAE
jgi:hypothetical protein